MQYLLALLPLLASGAFASPIVKRANNQLIQSVTSGLCISPAASAGGIGGGVNIISEECDTAAGWDLSPGSGSIVLSGANYAIDAGENPGASGGLKIWQSYPGLYQQTFYWTDDNRLAITGGTQCITNSPSGPGYEPCGTGNQDQEYRIYDRGSGPTPSASVSQSASSTSSGPTSSATPTGFDILPNVRRGSSFPKASAGQRLHPYGRSDLCVTVQNGYAAEGAAVQLSYCVAEEDGNSQFQLWDYQNGVRGNIALHSNPSLCLDAGNDPANGSGLKLWSCGDGWLQQSWTHEGINLLSLDNNQCLDVRKESSPGTQKPYNSVADLQTWECDRDGDRDPYQVFFEDVVPNN